MTQGNPFGPTGGRWMVHTKFKALWRAGKTLDEIAAANERIEGWKPSRSAVRKHADLLELGRRNVSHKELFPWKSIRPEHNSSELRHMLQAESRRRQLRTGEELSETDRKLVGLLDNYLFGRGKMMVVAYHPEVGFSLVPREDHDEDIVRRPRGDCYSAPDLASGERVPVRQRAAGGASARTPTFSTE